MANVWLMNGCCRVPKPGTGTGLETTSDMQIDMASYSDGDCCILEPSRDAEQIRRNCKRRALNVSLMMAAACSNQVDTQIDKAL